MTRRDIQLLLESPVTHAIRVGAGNVLFVAALVAIVAGAWHYVDGQFLFRGIIGGIVLFALADLVAPLPQGRKR